MFPSELADLARWCDRTLAEAAEVYRYISEVLTRPRPAGVNLAPELIRPLMELSARQAEVQERHAGPERAWLVTAQRFGDALR